VRALTVLEQVADCHGEYADRWEIRIRELTSFAWKKVVRRAERIEQVPIVCKALLFFTWSIKCQSSFRMY
jgi:hypothetical protein